MSEQTKTSDTRPSWRERRRARRQERLERRYFDDQRLREMDCGADELNTTTRAGAYGTPWMAFGGGDGGGCGGDGGGGGC